MPHLAAEDPVFDLQKILDELLGANPRALHQAGPAGGEQLGDLPGQPAPAARQGGPAAAPLGRHISPPPAGAPAADTGAPAARTAASADATPLAPVSLEELLRSVLGDRLQRPAVGPTSAPVAAGELLRKLEQETGARPEGALEVLAEILAQATAGVREGAARLDAATGASKMSRQAIEQLSGKSAEQVLAELKAVIADNQLGAGAALGGLGALILGTAAGRSLAATAAKLGGLAMIGGLAYKAYQNYQQGRPVPSTAPTTQPQNLLLAPPGSGFEPHALSDQRAGLLIRTMIAAAAADGRIDAAERQRILDALRKTAPSLEAQRFLIEAVQRPPSPADLASEVSSPEQAAEVYTAARIAVDVDSEEEHAFLAALAERLGIDEELAAHVEAVARGR
jgi:uncharacterized membrane protein YebE (DUF533 family)